MDIESVIRGVGKRMLVDFEDISSQVTHRGAKGRIRERRIVTDYLEKYLPGNIGIGNGEIFSITGEVSPETDTVLYDKFSTPFLLKDECYQVFPVECVYGVVEVKSYLSKDELIDSGRKMETIKRFPKVAFEPQTGPIVRTTTLYGRELSNFPIVGFVIAYDSQDLTGLADELNSNQNNLAPEQRTDSIWVLKRGMIIPLNLETNKYEFTPGPKTVYVPVESDNPLLLFTLHLQTLMSSAWMRPFRIQHYLEKAVYGNVKYNLPAGSLTLDLIRNLLPKINPPQ